MKLTREEWSRRTFILSLTGTVMVLNHSIQGPTVIIEYSSQQKNAAHIHNMYRDPTNDYGKKLL
jgi:hypothetical protein